MRRCFSTAIVRVTSASARAPATFTFARNGVLVGAALSTALSSAPPDLPAAFLRACASAPTPLAVAPPSHALADADADYLFLVDAAADKISVFESSAEPTFTGDARAFHRLVERGFGQC